MSEYVHLLGAEDVRRAGHEMRQAAEEIKRAASAIEESVRLQQRLMDDWLERFQAVLERGGENV